jgi:4-methylaminobutanoate oxidase (formaldehyde-forming)
VARGIRRSPLYDILKQQGAVYGSKNGWERPLWFAPESVEAVDQLAYINPGWKPYVADEHTHIRQHVGLIDQTSFAKFELIGKKALDILQRIMVSNIDAPIGAVIYSQLCNERGGIEADLTITRIAKNHFYIVTGSGFAVHDEDCIRRQLPSDDSVQLIDMTSAYAVINLCGPKAREVLAPVCEDDVSNDSFGFATSRQITIGAAPVRALRIGYAGELGWELHVPTEYALHVYETLWQSGKEHQIRNVGYRAIDSLRMEKGYLYWSSDITPDYTPLEAGLGFRIHFGSKGDYIARAALQRQKSDGVTRKLCTFVSDDDLPVFGGETILYQGEVVSLATSAAFGFSVGKTILYGYLPTELAAQTEFELESFSQRHPIRRVQGPLYDPQNQRLKA